MSLGRATMGSLTAANTKFCLDFFKELSKVKRNENIFFSPLSISAALSMIQLGARGSTAEEIEKHELKQGKADLPAKWHHLVQKHGERILLKTAFPWCLQCEEAGGAHSQFQELLSALGKSGATCSLSIANRLFGEVTFQFLQQYLNSTRTLYHAELKAMDFINAAEQCRKKMNSWVEKQTCGKIKDLFPPGSINHTTVLVLVNAIYFKGKWAIRFQEENTREMPFRLNKKEHKNVLMMCQTGNYKLARRQEEQVTVLELPYAGEELSMFILLPENICDESTGLEQLESAVTYEKLVEWTDMKNVFPREIKVYLPRFRMEESCELTPVLQALGMRNAFILEQADFSGLSIKPQLYLSEAIHKSFVEVNEEGTEAAAASAWFVIMEASYSCTTYEFRADHPFLFLIKHNPSKNILFFGRCCSP
ncbi:leukocyte elastase inhibitor-like [Limosa lapponica baueri]|uniref:Leukocyte elastase inhibitor-like n=1 Tax=Limosa lapponica baueri TaxID=1758121 RepID=A0A2I0UCU1_LIMLA|nr:leukocyte elastase inhibitor-like [Limosa lapponica baueri]